MKLTILVPSEEYMTYAGARIRYQRVAPHLRTQGVELSFEVIGAFDAARSDADAVLISKCHDARSVLAAALLSRRGKLVGVDLFDNYFTDASDSRLLRFRSWLSQLLENCDFALCSTASMVGVVEQYRAGLPTHVMNDPAPEVDLARLKQTLADKLSRATTERRLDVCWFGAGDNPYFEVGLSDLAAHGALLAELALSGMDVRLSVLTNERALSAEGLALINRLPVRTRVAEWSEAAEEEALGEALVAFIPVAAQDFSVAKSLNRAVTALTNGCQVLSAGFPLYSALEPLIYRGVDDLLQDLASGSLRLAQDRLDVLDAKLDDHASAPVESARLAAFLRGLPRHASPLLPVAVLHGNTTPAAVHETARHAGNLSVASPFTAAPLDFDIIFRGSASGFAMLVSRPASAKLLREAGVELVESDPIRGIDFFELVETGSRGRHGLRRLEEWSAEPLPVQLSTYASAFEEMATRITRCFGPHQFILSEVAQVPYPLVRLAA